MQKEFDAIILKCVQDGLSVLGEDGKGVVLWLWHTKRGLSTEKIPSNVGEFSKLLLDTFGAGAAIIESQIVKEIELSFNLPDHMTSDLPAIVQFAREQFSQDK